MDTNSTESSGLDQELIDRVSESLSDLVAAAVVQVGPDITAALLIAYLNDVNTQTIAGRRISA